VLKQSFISRIALALPLMEITMESHVSRRFAADGDWERWHTHTEKI